MVQYRKGIFFIVLVLATLVPAVCTASEISSSVPLGSAETIVLAGTPVPTPAPAPKRPW